MAQASHPQNYTVAELFCGCGGFSHGFARSRRFDVVFGNDLKRAALRTFQFNHYSRGGSPAVVEQDIRTVSITDIVNVLRRRHDGAEELDCLLGGPPCQGFSQMRRSESCP